MVLPPIAFKGHIFFANVILGDLQIYSVKL